MRSEEGGTRAVAGRRRFRFRGDDGVAEERRGKKREEEHGAEPCVG